MPGKKEIVDILRNATGNCTKAEAAQSVDVIFEAIALICSRGGERLTIKGFGSFEVKVRKAKTGRNPKTGEVVQIASKRVLTFKAAKP